MPNSPAPTKSQNTAGHSGRIRKLQDLIGRVDRMPDADSRALVEELLHSVMQLHGSGLSQMLEIALPRDDGTYQALIDDPTLRSLLLIHDLHPLTLEERMDQAIAKVLPYMKSHGGDLQVVEIVDGTVKLRLKGTCKSCPSSAITLDLAVRAAFEEFCPDLVGFEVLPMEPDPVPVPAPAEKLVCLGEAALA